MRQRRLLEQQAFIIASTQSTDKLESGLVLGRWCYSCLLQTSRTMSRLSDGTESHASSFAYKNHTAGRLVFESLTMPCAHI